MPLTRRALLAMLPGGLGAIGLGAAKPEATQMNTIERAPTLFIPHGGGPWPILPLPSMDAVEGEALAGYMRSIATLPQQTPRFLVVISAHWEAPKVTVHAGASPGMLYDYSGFSPESYTLEWPAPGAPERAEQALGLLEEAGFAVARERQRGFDHGTFIPLMLAYPQPNLPVLQISLKRGLDPEEHLALGRALAPLRDEGGFIIGSGNSYHNLRALFRGGPRAKQEAAAFDAWLRAAVEAPPTERHKLLAEWSKAPAARACHPREEHLIPLMVAAGAAVEDAGRVGWSGSMGGLALSAHHFG